MPGGNKNIRPEDGKQFSANYQPKNRRGPSIMTKIKKMAFEKDEYLNLSNVEELDDDGFPTGKKVNVRVKLLKADAIALHFLSRLRKSDNLMKFFIEQVDGKAVQNFNIQSGNDRLSEEDLDNAIAEYENIIKNEGK